MGKKLEADITIRNRATLTVETVKNQNYLTDDTAGIKKPIIRQEVSVKNEKNMEIEL